MNKNNDILIVIVTYNRLELLKRCLDFVFKQTFNKFDVLVVNNSSTDGTQQYLIENTNLNFLTQKNGGSCLGWHTGIAKALKYNYKYAWLMDDDGFPKEDALEKLLSYITLEMSCISSIVLNESKNGKLTFPLPKLNEKMLPILFNKKRNFKTINEIESDLYPYIHPFNGALISVEAIKHIGNVDLSYFIYGDETDYYYRLRKVGQVFTCKHAVHYHPDVSIRKIEGERVYYFIRNTIINNHKYFDKVIIRNCGAVVIVLYRILKRNGLKELLSHLFGIKAKFVYLGIWHGLFGKNITLN